MQCSAACAVQCAVRSARRAVHNAVCAHGMIRGAAAQRDARARGCGWQERNILSKKGARHKRGWHSRYNICERRRGKSAAQQQQRGAGASKIMRPMRRKQVRSTAWSALCAGAAQAAAQHALYERRPAGKQADP
jgi:hypothetical protein